MGCTCTASSPSLPFFLSNLHILITHLTHVCILCTSPALKTSGQESLSTPYPYHTGVEFHWSNGVLINMLIKKKMGLFFLSDQQASPVFSSSESTNKMWIKGFLRENYCQISHRTAKTDASLRDGC